MRDLAGFGSGAGFAYEERLYPSLLNILELRHFLDRTVDLYLGGFYACIPIALLAILGILSLLDYEDSFNRLLLSWALVPSAMVLVDFPWHARFLYLAPFNIFAALGILSGARQLSKLSESKGLRCVAPLAYWVFYIVSVMLLLNYAVRCVAIKQFGPSGLTTTP